MAGAAACLLAGAGGAGCSPPAPVAGTYQSGSRLHAPLAGTVMGGCAPPLEAVVFSTTGMASKVVSLNGAYVGPVFNGYGSSCALTTPGASGVDLWRIGAPVDADTVFPPITERTEGDAAGVPPACDTCTDGIQDGTETDVDCGGSCAACGSYHACHTSSDCVSQICTSGTCVPPVPQCSDGLEDGNETAVDCGGGTCPPCQEGEGCNTDSDCASVFCAHVNGASAGVCALATCAADLCAPSCPGFPCAVGAPCVTSFECESSVCLAGVCAPLNGCDPATAVDLTKMNNVTISFGGALGNVYSPACILISGNPPLTTITFQGDFATNPLQGGEVLGGVETPATMPPLSGAVTSGTTYSFPVGPMAVGFYSIPNGTSGMKGAIFVVLP